MGLALSISIDLDATECCSCGVRFAMPTSMIAARRTDHATFYCPNGHTLSFRAESEAEKLRRALDFEKRRRESAEADAAQARKRVDEIARSNAALRGEVTKIKNRVGNGVCPCCRRSFTNLQRHMHTKHPTFKDEEAATAADGADKQ